MIRNTLFLCLVLVGLQAGTSGAVIRTVSQFGTADTTSIIGAIAVSGSGDTILVGEGFYGDSLSPVNHSISNRRLTIIGAGWDRVRVGGYFTISGEQSSNTRIVGISFGFSNNPCRVGSNADLVTIERCKMSGGSNAWDDPVLDLNGGNTTVNDCILSATNGNASPVLLRQSTGATVRFVGCLFTHQTSNHEKETVVCYNEYLVGPTYFTNCVFLNVWRPFWYEAPQTQHPVNMTNCVLYDWSSGANRTWGIYPAGSTFSYIAAGLNSPAFLGTFSNTVALSSDPTFHPFVTYDAGLNYVHGTSNLHLNNIANRGLLLTDTGDPNILDLDGSRSDFGVYGGPRPLVDNGVPAFPFVISLDVPGAAQPASQLNVNSVGRVGPHY